MSPPLQPPRPRRKSSPHHLNPNHPHAPAHAALRGRVVGWIPQDPLAALHPLRTAGSQLVEALRVMRGQSREHARREAEALFARVQLPDPAAALHRFPHQFSGGQRQRIAIAIALATRPRVLIADEPTSSLDARIARDILDLLDTLRREDGLALLLISHDLPLVGAYAQRLVVLQRGALVERGDTRAVFADPQQAYTRELLAADRLAPLPPARDDATVLLRGEYLRMRYPLIVTRQAAPTRAPGASSWPEPRPSPVR